MFGKLISFFRDSKNEHLATWVQTMAVVFGVIIATFQLSAALEGSSYKKGEAYLAYEREFSSNISRKIGMVYEYHVNREKLSEEKYDELYSLDEFLEIKDSVQDFITRLSACGTYEVCLPEHVDNLVCSISKNMYTYLSMDVSWPLEWKIKFNKPIFYKEKINEHCSLLGRLSF